MLPTSPTAYLTDCYVRLRDAQRGHYIASDYYRRLHYGIGVPLIVATTVVSSSLLVDTAQARPWALGLSIVAAVLAAVQTFLRPDERSERHRAAATAYGALKRDVEIALLQQKDAAAQAAVLVEKWESVAATAPVTPQSVRRKVRKATPPPRDEPEPIPPASVDAREIPSRPRGGEEPSG